MNHLSSIRSILFVFTLLFSVDCWAKPSFSIEGEYLCWKPDQDGMSFALGVDNVNIGTGQNTTLLSQDFDWDSGFRLGLHSKLPCTCLDMLFQWTHFHARSSTTPTRDLIYAVTLQGAGATSLFGGTSLGGSVTSRWRMDLDFFDIIFAYQWSPLCGVVIAPEMGVRGGWITQNQKINFNGFTNAVGADPIDAEVKEINNFYGAGPSIGIRSLYCLWNLFSLTARVNTSFLYGQHFSPTRYLIPGIAQPNFKTDASRNLLLPVLQMQLGGEWSSSMGQYCRFTLGASYETNYFLETWRILNSNSQTVFVAELDHGNLSLQGITVRGTIHF